MNLDYKILQLMPAEGWRAEVEFESGESVFYPLVAWALCKVESTDERAEEWQQVIAVICPEGEGPALIEEAFPKRDPARLVDYRKDD